MKKTVSITIFLSFLLVLGINANEFRTWTSANGKNTVEARLISISQDGKTVTLQRFTDGKKGKFELEKLSNEDNEYIIETTFFSFDPAQNIFDAAHAGKVKEVEFFINRGADVNVKNREGNTPLHLVVYRGELDIAEFLVSNGADVNAKNNDGWTPLHRVKNLSTAKFLVSKGADVNAKNKWGWTPRDAATEWRYTTVADYLSSIEKALLAAKAEREQAERASLNARIRDTLERNAIRQAILEEERRHAIYKDERRKLNLD